MKNRFQIRLYQDGDTASMIDLFRSSIRQVVIKDYTQAQTLVWAPDEVDAALWTERCLNRPTWLAFDQDHLAGFIDLETDGHLDLLYVSPHYQGVGVGTCLYLFVEEQAQENNNDRIFVESSLTARPFFERKGFSVVESQVVERAGEQFQNFKMEKTLYYGD